MNCSDFYIIKIRFYASKYLMKKWHETDKMPKQHHYRGVEINRFFWAFFQQATGMSDKEFIGDKGFAYALRAKEKAIELLEDKYGIYITNMEGNYYYFVHKSMHKLFEWCKTDIKNPYEVLKKTNVLPYQFHLSKYWHDYDKI